MAGDDDSDAPSGHGHWRAILGVLLLVPLGFLLILILTGAYTVFLVISGSMEPALQIGDRIVVDANGYPERFDIVAFRDPNDPETLLVKRVIGLGGDEVSVHRGLLYVNGEVQYNPTIIGNRVNWPDLHHVIPDGSFFLLGDNRNDSYDSLNFGPIPEDDIEGVLWFTVWPPSRFGRVDDFQNHHREAE